MTAHRGAAADGRDAGLQPERTRLAWRRTTLSCSVAAVLALRQVLHGAGSAVEVTGAAGIALLWLAFLGLAHRRMRALAADPPPPLAPRAALAAVLCTLALALAAVTLVV
ncbi:DUF202 domain-containing protein [Streptomyces sp. NPDC091268]|uniref:DUF202 domain-containing protein n=1 Tax=Streptomyces sp. NPDC091268 TaxID=3365979 RepID=UPI0037F6BECF